MLKSANLLLPSPVQPLSDAIFEQAGINVFLKRDDLIHPEISGNKWRKLKFNLLEAIKQEATAIISFGGAYSNHLYALASLGKMTGVRTIGIVRGDELNTGSSPTLLHCSQQGMEFHFITREEYRAKEDGYYFKQLIQSVEKPFIVPEGGTNRFALPGVSEIIRECREEGLDPDFYVVPAGTGGTAAGLLSGGKNVIAVAVLKGGDFLRQDIASRLTDSPDAGKLYLQTDYHFGGYARYTDELIEFIADFETRQGIRIEQVYTGKMLFGLYDLIKRGYFAPGTTLVAVHTGGLQGKLEPNLS